MSNPQQLVQKLWNYCNILRDDGVAEISVVEELEAAVFANLQRPTRLRQSILQKAFTGNLPE
jgi:hypothetical protein